MPRYDQKAYTTLMARIPQELADEVKRYAMQHRCSVSELIRDGLELRLEQGDVPGRTTGNHGDTGEEVRHEVRQELQALAPMIQAWIQDAVRQTREEVRHEVIPHDTKGQTEVIPKDVRGQTSLGKGHTEVIPQSADFDATRFYLGKLCPKGHDYQNSGKTLLRRSNNNCPVCNNERRRERRAQQKDE